MTVSHTTDYNPRNTAHRAALAEGITAALAAAGFEEVPRTYGRYATKEQVFSKRVDLPTIEELIGAPCPGQMTVRVYSTIGFDGLVRNAGADSIKVAAVYVDRKGKTRGIGSDTRVHRTGTIERVLERLTSRLGNVSKTATQPCRCDDCGAPKFKSKKGNMVCAEFCWNDPTVQARKAAKRQAKVREEAKATGVNPHPWLGPAPAGLPF